jgi:hypothetical protein
MDSARPAAASQRSEALTQANRIRSAQAELKCALEAGRCTAADVISDPLWSARNMQVAQVVTSQRGWGPIRSRRLLRSASVPDHKKLGALTERQRGALLAMLEARERERARMNGLGSR